ncbi:hypothetical protein CA603_49490, partial [Paraburkholderia hospita]
ERLGLPPGWLDTPRTEAEIPESVSRMLTPASRGRVSAQQHAPLSKAHTKRSRAGDPGDAESPAPVSASATGDQETIVVSPQVHVNDFTDDLAGRPLQESNREAPSVKPANLESLPAPAVPQRNAVPLPFSSVTSLDNLHGIEPIAEALIKTLAGKARTGRLDELKALELLQQAILL